MYSLNQKLKQSYIYSITGYRFNNPILTLSLK